MFRDDGTIPNNPALPVLVLRYVTTTEDLVNFFKSRFEENGWGGVWEDGIFDYHHFHSNAHEVLGIARGKARVQLGGAEGRIVEVEEGDVLILPAGTGHRNAGSSPDLIVIGAYPKGQEAYDICRDKKDDPDISRRIASVPLPEADPLTGAEGVLSEYWKSPRFS